MRRLLASFFLVMAAFTGCSQEGVQVPLELSSFIDVLKQEGVDGSIVIRRPINEDMEYVAEYSIAKYTSTRVLSFFKCKDVAKAQANFEESLKNTKLTGQARNGTIIMAATFYPPDDEAVEKIKALFLAHEFER